MSSRLYLSSELNIMKLYQLYTDKEDSLPVTQCVFRRAFKEHEPPLPIFKPKKKKNFVYVMLLSGQRQQTQMKNIENILREKTPSR